MKAWTNAHGFAALATLLALVACEDSPSNLESEERQPGLEAWLDAEGRINPATVVHTPSDGDGPVLIRIRDHTGAVVEEQEIAIGNGLPQILSYLSPEESARALEAMNVMARRLSEGGIPEERVLSAVRTLTENMSPEDRARVLRGIDREVAK